MPGNSLADIKRMFKKEQPVVVKAKTEKKAKKEVEETSEE